MIDYTKASRRQLLARIEELELAHLSLEPQDELTNLPFHLAPTPLAILRLLWKAEGRFLSSDYFCDILGNGHDDWKPTLKAQINYLRKSLPPGVLVEAAYSRGYRLSLQSRTNLKEALSLPQEPRVSDRPRPVASAGRSYRNPLRKIDHE